MLCDTREETCDIMDVFTAPSGKVVYTNSWEFIDHLNKVFEEDGFRGLWFTLRFIVGDGTDSNAKRVILADCGEFYNDQRS